LLTPQDAERKMKSSRLITEWVPSYMHRAPLFMLPSKLN
jgi:hypothetical protein